MLHFTCFQVKDTKDKREVGAVKVRNATSQVRAMQACVTATLSQTHTHSATDTQIHKHKDHIKAKSASLFYVPLHSSWGVVTHAKKKKKEKKLSVARNIAKYIRKQER